ncbi:MAG: hypothetical protein ACLPQS_16760 [Acidimicrobiales bacterium]
MSHPEARSPDQERAVQLLSGLIGEVRRPLRKTPAARNNDVAGARAVMVALAMMSAGLLDEPSVIDLLREGRPSTRDRKRRPRELPVADPWADEEGLIIPCPVRAKLRNALIDIQVLCSTEKSARLIARLKSFRAMSPTLSQKLAVGSLQVSGSDGVTYRLRDQTRQMPSSWITLELDPAPSTSLSWFEFTDVSDEVTRVPLAIPISTVTTSANSTSMYDGAELFLLRQVGTLLSLTSEFGSEAFAEGGVLDGALHGLQELVQALTDVQALQDPNGVAQAVDGLIGALRGEQHPRHLPPSWRSMLDANKNKETDGTTGGIVVDKEMTPAGERSVWLDTLVSWPERFTLWAFCEPDATVGTDHVLSIPAVGWSATDDTGGSYTGFPEIVWESGTGVEIVVSFAPRLNPGATCLEVSCFEGTEQSTMRIPLATWAVPTRRVAP